ncbi:ParB/RepB/Spo0J family partition protein [Sphingomicrobium marinum]|uniref:ParB/RepB/Spo0J family partition protein n=1 Tax=Sphingomicrobium marinum TaxID=1227950 RepID=UPI00223EF137|nr:ParB/RepB/Spo0J family partition protein [Sphingomicrobium marinum]
MKKPTGLGRGLSALLDDADQRAGKKPVGTGASIERLSISSIKPNPAQPRRQFDDTALEELAASIAEKGVLQPILVRPAGGGYQIIAGERRWRAAQKAQLHEIPAIIRSFDDEAVAEIALIENIQREDLNAIEEAKGYKALAETYGHDQATIGKLVGKSRSHIANMMRLLDLPSDVAELLMKGDISMGHARAVLTAEDPSNLAKAIVAQGLSVREAEVRAKEGKAGGSTSKKGAKTAHPVDADLKALESQLGDMLGLKVKIAHGNKGGKVQLAYRTLDQLDMVCQRLSGEPI